jgi:hypothetical protein
MIRVLPITRAGKIRFSFLLVLLLLVIIDLCAIPVYWTTRYRPQEGDLIFQSLIRSELVRVIEGATHSDFSHVGVLRKDGSGNWKVVESIGSVHETPLWQYIARGRRDHFAVFRLQAGYAKFIPKFETELDKYYGRPYDFRFAMDDDFIYCSELPYKAFLSASGIKLGRLSTVGELDWKPFEKSIREMDGGGLPLDRVLISPVNLSRAKELSLVFNNGYIGI